MAKSITNETVAWEDRKHHLWFPISFTKYQLTEEHLYTQRGFMNTHYDELLLYRAIDICVKRSFGQKVFGTGTILISTKADTQGQVTLENVKNVLNLKGLLAEKIEAARQKHGVVGREFFSHESTESTEDSYE